VKPALNLEAGGHPVRDRLWRTIFCARHAVKTNERWRGVSNDLNNAGAYAQLARLEPTAVGGQSRRLQLPSLEQLSVGVAARCSGIIWGGNERGFLAGPFSGRYTLGLGLKCSPLMLCDTGSASRTHDAPMREGCRVNDRDAFEDIEDEQIGVPGYDHIGVAVHG